MSEDTQTIAVILTKLEHMSGAIEEVKDSLRTSASVHVTRSEWELRNKTVDERHQETVRRVQLLEHRRFPWPTLIATAVGLVALSNFVFEWLPKILN